MHMVAIILGVEIASEIESSTPSWKNRILAEYGLDPLTSGSWAQHAPTVPLCLLMKVVI